MEQGNLLDVIRTEAPTMEMYAPCCAGCPAWELTCLPQRMPPCYVAVEDMEREKKKAPARTGAMGK